MIEQFIHPGFSPGAEALLRVVAGALLFIQGLVTLPHAWRFYSTERYRGYTDSTPFRDIVLHPAGVAIIEFVWLASTLCIAFDRWTFVAALLNFLIARYFFVNLRWHGILRGMGAPGHMNQWLSALLLGFAFADFADRSGYLRSAVVFTFRFDFALIMIIAGIYKVTAGYPKNEGMERGMVNPYWGYWWKAYKSVHPRSAIFALFNHLAYLTEIGAGVLMLIPPLAPWGALALLLSFVFISANIRLTFLAELVMACCLLFITPGSLFDRILGHYINAVAPQPHQGGVWAWVAVILGTALYVYAAMLPLVYGAMCFNFYARKSLPGTIQDAVDWWQRFFGLILWRVFTIDVTNFYVNVYAVNPESGHRRLISEIKPFDASRGFRYGHVAEFICLASIFTTLKYYPNNPSLFHKRVVRYARTIPRGASENVLFEYVGILKNHAYEFAPVREFIVNPEAGTVEEKVLIASYDVRTGASTSPVFAGTTVGTYARRT